MDCLDLGHCSIKKVQWFNLSFYCADSYYLPFILFLDSQDLRITTGKSVKLRNLVRSTNLVKSTCPKPIMNDDGKLTLIFHDEALLRICNSNIDEQYSQPRVELRCHICEET